MAVGAGRAVVWRELSGVMTSRWGDGSTFVKDAIGDGQWCGETRRRNVESMCFLSLNLRFPGLTCHHAWRTFSNVRLVCRDLFPSRQVIHTLNIP